MRKISAMYQFSGGADPAHQCVECCNCKRFQRGSRKVYKCMLYGNTNSETSDWNSMSMACKLFNVQYHPLGFWPKEEVIRFVTENDIPICSVYGEAKQDLQGNWILTGEQRTGCIVCGFGCHLESEPNRFQRLRDSDNESHRKICEFAMGIKNNGVTYEEALNDCGVNTKTWEQLGQMTIQDFPEIMPESYRGEAQK